MNLKIALATLLVSGSAFGLVNTGKEIARPGQGSGAIIDANRGVVAEKAKKDLKAAQEQGLQVQSKAATVAEQAGQILGTPDDVAYGKKAVNAAKQKLEGCESAVCVSMKTGQIADLALHGDKDANTAIFEAVTEVRENRNLKTDEAVNKSLSDRGLNAEEVAEACGTPAA